MPARHGIACANGTAALDIAVQVQIQDFKLFDPMGSHAVLISTGLQALGLGQGDEVRTSYTGHVSLARLMRLA